MTEAAGFEPADGDRRHALATRCRTSWRRLQRRKERESNPQGLATHPFSRRDTAPMAVLPNDGPGRARTCTSPGKSRELCRLELRSRGCGRQESNLRRPAFQAGALPTELRPRGRRGWTRTSSLLLVRQALFAIELLACACPQAADRLAGTAGRETPKAAAFAADRSSEVPREGLEPSRAWPTALSTPRVYRSATSM
jgi:hypothetical protein